MPLLSCFVCTRRARACLSAQRYPGGAAAGASRYRGCAAAGPEHFTASRHPAGSRRPRLDAGSGELPSRRPYQRPTAGGEGHGRNSLPGDQVLLGGVRMSLQEDPGLTESSWWQLTDVERLLCYLPLCGHHRKLRLLACACCRRIWTQPRGSTQPACRGHRRALC